MSRVAIFPWVSLALLACVCLAGTEARAQKNDQQSVRTLQGQVTDSSRQPVADAVVYLKNSKDMSVKTYISDKQGNYRFNALSMNVDYEIHAEAQGRRSEVRKLSSFDNRKLVTLHLSVK